MSGWMALRALSVSYCFLFEEIVFLVAFLPHRWWWFWNTCSSLAFFPGIVFMRWLWMKTSLTSRLASWAWRRQTTTSDMISFSCWLCFSTGLYSWWGHFGYIPLKSDDESCFNLQEQISPPSCFRRFFCLKHLIKVCMCVRAALRPVGPRGPSGRAGPTRELQGWGEEERVEESRKEESRKRWGGGGSSQYSIHPGKTGNVQTRSTHKGLCRYFLGVGTYTETKGTCFLSSFVLSPHMVKIHGQYGSIFCICIWVKP